MKIQIHRNLRDVQTLDVTRVVVLDEYDNPVALAVSLDDGIILAETAGNPVEFNSLLKSIGINKTVVVHGVKQDPLPTIKLSGP